MYIKDLLLPENIQESIEKTNEKKRMADLNLKKDQKRAELKAQDRVSFEDYLTSEKLTKIFDLGEACRCGGESSTEICCSC